MKGTWYIRDTQNDRETISVVEDKLMGFDPMVFESDTGLRVQYKSGETWLFPWTHVVRVVFSPAKSE